MARERVLCCNWCLERADGERAESRTWAWSGKSTISGMMMIRTTTGRDREKWPVEHKAHPRTRTTRAQMTQNSLDTTERNRANQARHARTSKQSSHKEHQLRRSEVAAVRTENPHSMHILVYLRSPKWTLPPNSFCALRCYTLRQIFVCRWISNFLWLRDAVVLLWKLSEQLPGKLAASGK